MEISLLIGYFLAVLVGISLGLIGSGGSILSVPILVYVLHVEPVLATGYSLFIVGVSALVGGIQKAKQHLVDFKKVALFGIPTIIAVFLTRNYIVPAIPEVLAEFDSFRLTKSVFVMLVFAVVMIIASIRMIKPNLPKTCEDDKPINLLSIAFQGLWIGLVAGFVGAGGGFLIIPALYFLAKIPMKKAIGTSLFIVAFQSLIGFLGDLNRTPTIDWNLLLSFTLASVIGIFIGNYLSKYVSGEKLKTSFGWFVLLMGIYIILKEVVL